MAEDDGLEPRDVIYAAFIPPEWAEHYIRATDIPLQQLAQVVQKAEESQPLEDMVPAQYHDFRDVFSKEAFDELPLWKAWDHTIDLTPGTELPCSQCRQENGPICELPTETDLTAKACPYYPPKISNEFDT